MRYSIFKREGGNLPCFFSMEREAPIATGGIKCEGFEILLSWLSTSPAMAARKVKDARLSRGTPTW
jgi:hypothetical protein